jgi:LPS O-antigen subunit length determinant protein (WzzB/FepE family)
MRVALWLYPPSWRARYEREFAALLEESASGWRECWDVARGGMRMRMTAFVGVTAALAILGAAGAAIWSLSVPDTYVSTAVFQAGNATVEDLQKLQTRILSRGSLAEVVGAEDVYPEERKINPLEDVIARMRNQDIRVYPVARPFQDPLQFAISFRYRDRAKAQAVVQRLGAKFAAAPARVEVLNPPSLPDRASNPNRLRITIFGALAGFAVSLLLFGVRRWPLVAASGVATAAAALALAFTIPDRWISTAVLSIEPATSDTLKAVLDDAVLQKIIEHPSLDLYAAERKKLPMAEVIRRMRERDLAVTTPKFVNLGPSVVVRFEAEDRYKAQAVVRMLVTALLEAQSGAPQVTVRVLDPARLPEQPVSPNRLVILLFGLTLGIAGGALWTRKRRAGALAATA